VGYDARRCLGGGASCDYERERERERESKWLAIRMGITP